MKTSAFSNPTPAELRDRADRFLLIAGHPFYRDLVELLDLIAVATVQHWSGKGFRYSLLPVTTNSVSSPMGLGSDSTPVHTKVGEVSTYLADSMQFYLEYACRFGARGAFYISPSFRGECCDSTHLSQFMHSELEIGNGTLETAIREAEDYVEALCRAILEHFPSELPNTKLPLDHLAEALDAGAFTRITFDEAAARLQGADGALRVLGEGTRTLTRIGEQELMRQLGPFLWVTHWDHLAVPFYQRSLRAGGRTVAANADLLFGPGEVIGAGERHATGVEIREALELHNVPPTSYQWYVRMKDDLPLASSGFGVGIERLLMWIFRHDDIRDIQLIMRDNYRSYVP